MNNVIKKVNKKENVSIFDEESQEPRLWEYKGFDDPVSREIYARAYNRIDGHDCKNCFYRISFIERVVQGVRQLRRKG